jgi:fluoride exporter
MQHLWLWVGAGGFLGSLSRWALYVYFSSFAASFPLATFTVNLAGSFFIGLLAGWFLHQPNYSLQAFLITGFCGGFTTFSAFSMDTLSLLQRGHMGTALLYASGSMAAGLLAAYAGIWLMRIYWSS